MASYYKKIDGKNYDRTMLDIAEGSVLRKGDGRISLADSRGIIRQIKDGGKITDIERRTLNYILENYKFTETALKNIEKSLSESLTPAAKEESKSEKKAPVHEEVPQVKEQSAKSSGRKIFFLLVLLLLVLFGVFALIKYFYKNVRPESIVIQKQDQAVSQKQEEAAVSKTESAVTTPAAEKTDTVQVKPLAENEYMIKDGDTLIKISEAVYGDYKMWDDIYKLNKGKIKNPTILYTGQVIQLPEKK